jgi:hypothetical protein
VYLAVIAGAMLLTILTVPLAACTATPTLTVLPTAVAIPPTLEPTNSPSPTATPTELPLTPTPPPPTPTPKPTVKPTVRPTKTPTLTPTPEWPAIPEQWQDKVFLKVTKNKLTFVNLSSRPIAANEGNMAEIQEKLGCMPIEQGWFSVVVDKGYQYPKDVEVVSPRLKNNEVRIELWCNYASRCTSPFNPRLIILQAAT